MQIKTLSYGRTFNNGNYESSKIDISVELDSKDNEDQAMDEMIAFVQETRKEEAKSAKR